MKTLVKLEAEVITEVLIAPIDLRLSKCNSTGLYAMHGHFVDIYPYVI